MWRVVFLILVGLSAFALGAWWWVDVERDGARFVGAVLALVGLGFLHLAAIEPRAPRRRRPRRR